MNKKQALESQIKKITKEIIQDAEFLSVLKNPIRIENHIERIESAINKRNKAENILRKLCA